jgi:putative nucleotidyltransferase with HDIG domain
MAVPTRTEALSLLMSTSPSPRLLQHMTVVAEVASFLAYRATQAGLAIDRRLVETAALLHDVDKALPPEHPLRALGHGKAGAAWLSEAGHAELARTLAAHPVMRLNAPDVETWLRDSPIEERIVAYADKRATQRVVSLEQRFERWQRKHPGYAARLDQALGVARRLEAELCAAIGVRADEVERLRWVDDAMARARDNGVLPAPSSSAADDVVPDTAAPDDGSVPAAATTADPTAAA